MLLGNVRVATLESTLSRSSAGFALIAARGSLLREGAVSLAGASWTFSGACKVKSSPTQELHRAKRAVSAETRIAFSDYAFMHTKHFGVCKDKARWIPAFALNDRQLREVLIAQANNYLWGGGGRRVPEIRSRDWKELNRLCTEKALALSTGGLSPEQTALILEHKRTVTASGGYLALIAAVAWRYWRSAESCVAVAESFGISPVKVRQIAHRLVCAARQLGLETFKHHKTFGRRVDLVERERLRWKVIEEKQNTGFVD